jgi:hypothetical protein
LGRTGHCGNAAIATRLFFREFGAFLKVSILFEDISRKIEDLVTSNQLKKVSQKVDFRLIAFKNLLQLVFSKILNNFLQERIFKNFGYENSEIITLSSKYQSLIIW